MRLKRLVDVVGALGLLTVLAPVLVVVTVAVAVGLGRPVLFRQARPGLDGRTFELVKFRTMRDATATDGTPLPDEARLTRLGRILRASSLDELPALWNVLRGDMSLVGPRPLLIPYLPLYSPREARRHEIRPGVTGWAQINGRNALAWDEKLELDVWYVEHRSFWLDVRILLRTLAVPFRREGITRDGHATSPRLDEERTGPPGTRVGDQ